MRRLIAVVAFGLALAGCVSPHHNHPFLVCTRAHESDTAGGYGAVSPGGQYRGGYQFDQQSWDSVARTAGWHFLIGKDPARVSPFWQDEMAFKYWQMAGNGPWNGRC